MLEDAYAEAIGRSWSDLFRQAAVSQAGPTRAPTRRRARTPASPR
jgi:hypothetical protein